MNAYIVIASVPYEGLRVAKVFFERDDAQQMVKDGNAYNQTVESVAGDEFGEWLRSHPVPDGYPQEEYSVEEHEIS